MPPRLRLPADREDRILADALDLIIEHGFHRVTIDAVAARSGASKATLYRHWASKEELLVSAVRRQSSMPFDVPDHGVFRDDVLFALRLASRWLAANGEVFRSLIDAGRRDQAIEREIERQIVEPHDAMWTNLVARWRGRDGIGGAVDLAWLHDLCEGLLLRQLAVTAPPPTDDELVRFTDEVLVPAFTA
ncbi:TetR/AcrR family transcriptional regulator [Amycolatopsis minnesotensis]|uniref:TetR/AcrR family transcriptional regulator n=1 Tax=Amycolatopsis minnesotensis TaxID=337894 RepID=A0ABP5DLI9_9PSEU